MKKFIVLFICLLVTSSAFAQTRTRYINAPGDQGNIQFYDEGSGTNIMTFSAGGVTISNLTAGSISIPAGSVGSAEIANYAITNIDIATNGVNGANILDRTIAAVDIGADVITTNELATSSVGSLEIIDATIVNADVNGSAAIAGSKLDMINGTGRIIATGRAITYAGDTTDIMVLGGSGTNGQVVTFTQPFIGNPIVICGYAVGVGGTNAYPISVNPTNFTIGGQAATLINWIARGNR